LIVAGLATIRGFPFAGFWRPSPVLPFEDER
jgi:hypothetical protein